jgi:chemotaxis signal transduction protein
MTVEAERRRRIDAELTERARRLARPAVEVATVPTVDLVGFSTGNERFAVATEFVFRLERIERIAPLPDAERHFAGIANFHGQLVPLVDLGLLLGSAACENPAFAVVLGDARADVGLLAETLQDMNPEPLDAFGTPAPPPRPVVHHITSDGVAVIDGAALLTDPRLTHHEEHVR